MQKIPLVDLDAQHRELRDELDAAIRGVVDTSRFVGGPDLNAFADEFAKFAGVAHAVPCNSGTDALTLAILAICGLGDGSREIITVSFTFPATVEVIALLGYRPVLVDVDPATCMMDLAQVEQAITPRTAAIIPVHLYGQMLAIDDLVDLAGRHGVPVIEDAAQAHGATWRGKSPGACSSAATYSFFPGKNLGAFGDAGAVVTQHKATADSIKQLADHGRSNKHTHATVGLNARMDNLQAAILRVKLRRLEEWNDHRRLVASWYDARLADIPGCQTLTTRADAKHVYHQYVVRLNDRERACSVLAENGIGFGVHYAVPTHMQPAYAYLAMEPQSMPHSVRASKEVLSLPMHPFLTEQDVDSVVDVVRSAACATVGV